MISNQVLQNAIDGIKGISKADFCIMDTEGNVLATTFDDTDDFLDPAKSFAQSPADSQVVSGCQFLKVFDDTQLEYVLLADGAGDDTFMLGRLAVFQVQSLITAYKERFDKDNFVKNLLLDNLLLVDIYNRAKKLHIELDARRIVFILETNKDREAYDVEKIRGLLSSRPRDFVTAVDEKSIVVVKELGAFDDYNDIDKTARLLQGAVGANADGTSVHVAYGTIVNEIKEVSRSYKEARMSLDVGRIFFEDRTVIAYNTLGIGRLIYQLPIPLCNMFIKEIFAKQSPDDFDEETIETIGKFFENSLNVSETSRQLFIHRNTLVYRLDKIQKATGLDLRNFEDAITFKIALMVSKYMKHMEETDFR